MRLAKLRDRFDELGVDALLVTQPQNRRYLSGFTGSAGVEGFNTAELFGKGEACAARCIGDSRRRIGGIHHDQADADLERNNLNEKTPLPFYIFSHHKILLSSWK